LSPVTFFVGANGSGKTSVMDALLFVAASIRSSLKQAVSARGIDSILHHPFSFPSRLNFDLTLSSSLGLSCRFQLVLRADDASSVSIEHEECRLRQPGGEQHYYVVENGTAQGS